MEQKLIIDKLKVITAFFLILTIKGFAQVHYSETISDYYHNYIDAATDSVVKLADYNDTLVQKIAYGEITGFVDTLIPIIRRDYQKVNNTSSVWLHSRSLAVLQKGEFINGIANGKFVAYEGKDSSYVNYINGLKEGQEIVNIVIFAKNHYEKGVLEGQSIVYAHDKTTPKRIHTFKNGKLHGLTTDFWDNSSNIFQIALYENGKLVDGIYYAFHPNGRFWIKGKIKNEKKRGKFYYYDEEGNLTRIEYFKKGQLVRRKRF